jgi:hypothetical protein
MMDEDTIYIQPDDDGMYQWESEDGEQHYGSEDELNAWAELNGYVDVPPVRPTPDTLTNEHGITLREMWDVAPDRRAAREAWAVERYKQLKEGS